MTSEDVQRLAPTLFGILFFIVLINFICYATYWLQGARYRLTRRMMSYWAIQVATLFVSPFFQKGHLAMCVPFSFHIFAIYYLHKGFFADYASVNSYKKHFLLYFLVAWPLAILLEGAFGKFLYTSLPLVVSLSYAILEMVFLVFFDRKKRFNSLQHKWIAFGLLAGVAHSFNFAFFRDDPSALIWGTTGHVMLVTMFGIFFSNFYTYMLHKGESDRLEGLVELKTSELKVRLEQVESLKDQREELFKMILHDISNPISAVLGYLSLLRNRRLNLSEQKRAEYLDKTSLAGESVANIIRQVRAMASTEGVRSTKEEISLSEAYNLLEAVHRPLYEKKGVELILPKPAPTGSIFANKEIFVHSVLGNLLSNSLKFSSPGTRVVIRQKLEGEKVVIAVSDQGRGIDKSKLKHIFDFENNQPSPGTQGELGLGLGLPLMKKYVEEFKGKVRVDSKVSDQNGEPNETTFLLEFGLAQHSQ